jgi:hypothetical protein
MLPTLLHDPSFSLIVSQQGIHTRGYSSPGLAGRHDLGVVDYRALTGLLLLWVPHFCERHGASLKDLKPDTTSLSKAKCFPVNR